MSEFPIPPDVLRRLAYARTLSFLASQLLAARNDVGNAESLVLQDASAEVIVRIALDVKNAHAPEKARFPELTQSLRRASPNIAHVLNSLDQLHEARNAIQHRLIIPADAQVEQFHREAAAAIRTIVEVGIGIPIERISLSEQFVDMIARQLYVQAEAAYWNGDDARAVVCLVACFEYGRFREQHRNWGSGITLNRVVAEALAEDDERFEGVVDYLKTLHDEVEILKLSIDYKDYRRFADVAIGELNLEYQLIPPFGSNADAMIEYWRSRLGGRKDLNGNPIPIGHGVRDDTRGWLAFALTFVARASLTWQRTSRTGFDEMLRGLFGGLSGKSEPTGKVNRGQSPRA